MDTHFEGPSPSSFREHRDRRSSGTHGPQALGNWWAQLLRRPMKTDQALDFLKMGGSECAAKEGGGCKEVTPSSQSSPSLELEGTKLLSAMLERGGHGSLQRPTREKAETSSAEIHWWIRVSPRDPMGEKRKLSVLIRSGPRPNEKMPAGETFFPIRRGRSWKLREAC